MAQQIKLQIRRANNEIWNSTENPPVLSQGEFGFNTTTGELKINIQEEDTPWIDSISLNPSNLIFLDNNKLYYKDQNGDHLEYTIESNNQFIYIYRPSLDNNTAYPPGSIVFDLNNKIIKYNSNTNLSNTWANLNNIKTISINDKGLLTNNGELLTNFPIVISGNHYVAANFVEDGPESQYVLQSNDSDKTIFGKLLLANSLQPGFLKIITENDKTQTSLEGELRYYLDEKGIPHLKLGNGINIWNDVPSIGGSSSLNFSIGSGDLQ